MRSKPSANRAATALRLAAQGVANSHSALGAYERRMRARLGAPKAMTATAHKLARLVYSMLRYGTAYVDAGQQAYEQKYRDRAAIPAEPSSPVITVLAALAFRKHRCENTP